MPRRDTKQRLLDAAAAVVRRDGATALTLDAVAAEAGVSKGGLLYHFASKRELLDAMLDGWLEEFASEIAAAEEGEGFGHGYVKASDMSGWAAAARATEFGLLAAASATPPGRSSSRATRPTRSTRPSRGWPPTGSGSTTCSVSPRPPASCANA